jgi:hypothetical protein
MGILSLPVAFYMLVFNLTVIIVPARCPSNAKKTDP